MASAYIYNVLDAHCCASHVASHHVFFEMATGKFANEGT